MENNKTAKKYKKNREEKVNITHIKNEISYYYKKYGFIRTIKKCFSKVVHAISYRIKNYQVARMNDYEKWIYYNEPSKEELEEQRHHTFEKQPKISVIIPMYNTPKQYFEELVDRMIEQTYSNWELCLADGSPEKNKEIEEICKKDDRIHYQFLAENRGISGNTNAALMMATGDYISLLDHDDLLAPFALYEVVKIINRHPEVEFIYSDEDKFTTLGGKRFDPHFKPDFAIDTLRSNNYICHFSTFKKELMDKLGGFRSNYDGAQDYDIIIRMSELTDKIIHIPKILYHWRVHPASTAAATAGDAKPYAFESGIRVLQDHLKRVGLEGTVEHGITLGIYRIRYAVKGTPKVTILIPNMDHIGELKTCINSILEQTTYPNYEIVVIENNSKKEETFAYYKEIEKNEKVSILYYPEKQFNYSKIINYGVKHTTGEYILQLNNDTEVLTPDWLEEMLGYAQREDVGAVGVKLFYPDDTIQHAGVIIGMGGIGGHVLKNLYKDHRGYFARDSFVQNMSAVTAACMLAKRNVYEEVDYMDEGFAVAFNDIDFCLKIREKGYLIIYDPYVMLTHYESKSRGYEDTPEKQKRFLGEIERFEKRWKKELEAGDPYFNPNFRLDVNDYIVKNTKVDFRNVT